MFLSFNSPAYGILLWHRARIVQTVEAHAINSLPTHHTQPTIEDRYDRSNALSQLFFGSLYVTRIPIICRID